MLTGELEDLPEPLTRLSTTGLLASEDAKKIGRGSTRRSGPGSSRASDDVYRTLSLTRPGREVMTGKSPSAELALSEPSRAIPREKKARADQARPRLVARGGRRDEPRPVRDVEGLAAARGHRAVRSGVRRLPRPHARGDRRRPPAHARGPRPRPGHRARQAGGLRKGDPGADPAGLKSSHSFWGCEWRSNALRSSWLLSGSPRHRVLAAGFTIEQVLSAPFPSDLTAAPSGGAVAWVFNDRGVRNIWIADPPDYRGRKVTAYAEDDGLEITDLSITPDGKRIVYVRGSGANRRGEVPESDVPRGRHGAGGLRRSDERRRAPAAGGRTRGRGRSKGRPGRLRRPRGRQGPGLPDRPRGRGEGDAALQGARRRREPLLLAGRLAAGFRQPPRRPQLRRRLRFHGEVAHVPGRERGPGLQSRVVARRKAPRLPEVSRQPGNPVVSPAPRGRALVDPRRGRGDREGPGDFPRGEGPGKRLPKRRRRQPAPLGRRRPDRLSVGEGRLDAPLLGVRGRRRRQSLDARRIRGRVRLAHPGPQADPLQLQPGRHRPPASLERVARGRKAVRADLRQGDRVVAGRDGRRIRRRVSAIRRPPPGAAGDSAVSRRKRPGPGARRDSRGLPRGLARRSRAGDLLRRPTG